MVYPPGLDYETVSSYIITFTATDTLGLTSTQITSFTVIDGPDPPDIINLPQTVIVLENVTLADDIFTVLTFDLQGDTVLFAVTVTPDYSQFYTTVIGGMFTWNLHYNNK